MRKFCSSVLKHKNRKREHNQTFRDIRSAVCKSDSDKLNVQSQKRVKESKDKQSCVRNRKRFKVFQYAAVITHEPVAACNSQQREAGRIQHMN